MEEKDFYDHARNKNPIVKYLVRQYFNKLHEKLSGLDISSTLDVGCGKGEVTTHLERLSSSNTIGIDYIEKKLKIIREHNNKIILACTDGRTLPFSDNLFDLVVATEVLEHQTRPEDMMKEIYRVTNKYGLFSVPNEPYWRLANIARLTHLRNFGNYPGHVQHWNRKSFEKFLSEFFSEVDVESLYIWNLALCKKQFSPTEHYFL